MEEEMETLIQGNGSLGISSNYRVVLNQEHPLLLIYLEEVILAWTELNT